MSTRVPGTWATEGALPAGSYEAEVDQIQGDEAFTAPDTHMGGVPNP